MSVNVEVLRRGRRWPVFALGTLLTGGAYFFSTGLTGLRPLVWLAPLPVLLLAFNSSARASFLTAFTASVLGSLNLFTYLSGLAPLAVVLLALAVPAVAFALSILAARYVLSRLRSWTTVFVFPLAWVAWEYLLAVLSPHGTFGNLAYTQTDFLPFMQLASVTGVWGLSFILTLVPSSIAVAWQLRQDQKQIARAMIATAILFFAAVGWGWFRLTRSEAGPRLKVGLAATDETVKYFETDKAEEALPVVNAYARRVRDLASRGATLVVLPEKFVGVAPDYADEVYRILSAAARDNNVTLVAGLNRTGAGRQRNMAVVFSPAGQVLAEYDKTHLLPGLESQYRPGDQVVSVPVSGTNSGVEICKDMDFPKLTARYGQAEVGVLLVPAWDFVRDEQLHSRMAVVRGIEQGLTVVRSAQQGLLTVSDEKGRIVAEDSSSRASEVLLVAEVQAGSGHTLYGVAGDWFAWLDLFLLALTLMLAALKSRRVAAPQTAEYAAPS